jgi:hypothetical protein
VRGLEGVFEAYYAQNGHSGLSHSLVICPYDCIHLRFYFGEAVAFSRGQKGACPLIGIVDLAPKANLVRRELSKRSDRSRDLPTNRQQME